MIHFLIGEVFQKNKSYIIWCLENLNWFFLSKKALDLICCPNQVKERVRKLNTEKPRPSGFRGYQHEAEDINYEKEAFDALTDGTYGRYEDYNGSDIWEETGH